jgi:hypothetical protein
MFQLPLKATAEILRNAEYNYSLNNLLKKESRKADRRKVFNGAIVVLHAVPAAPGSCTFRCATPRAGDTTHLPRKGRTREYGRDACDSRNR